jgi:hypothetical protein
LDYSDNEKLVNAIDRNTAATRALAIFILGSIPWTLGGLSLIVLGFLSVALDPDSRGLPFLFLAGLGIAIYGAVRTLLQAYKELKYSAFS